MYVLQIPEEPFKTKSILRQMGFESPELTTHHMDDDSVISLNVAGLPAYCYDKVKVLTQRISERVGAGKEKDLAWELAVSFAYDSFESLQDVIALQLSSFMESIFLVHDSLGLKEKESLESMKTDMYSSISKSHEQHRSCEFMYLSRVFTFIQGDITSPLGVYLYYRLEDKNVITFGLIIHSFPLGYFIHQYVKDIYDKENYTVVGIGKSATGKKTYLN